MAGTTAQIGGRSSRATARVLMSMAACYAVVELTLIEAARSGILDPLRAAMAAGATSVLLAFGRPVGLSGFSVATNAGLVTVAVGCLPIVHVALIAALFGFGVPSPLQRKLGWIAGLTLATMAIEVARIAVVARLLESGASGLDAIHLTIMPIATLGFLVACWLFELQTAPRA